MKKKIFLIVGLFAIIGLLCGCDFGDSYTTTGNSMQYTGKTIQESYNSFKGTTRIGQIELKQGNVLKLDIDVTTESGNLIVSLIDPSGNELFAVDSTKTPITKSITANENGKYSVKIKGEHKGSISLKSNYDFIDETDDYDD